MSVNIINIGEKEKKGGFVVFSLPALAAGAGSLGGGEAPDDGEYWDRDSGYESEACTDTAKIDERLETISSDITSNKNTVVRLDEDLHGLASNVEENIENLDKFEK